mmetsp:Transcript_22961/g.50061  ORF Transcript_22961/g.50061 Transcript_22961/m.50061 type:complete len:124 (-) Transcript_22961:70-441(-)
MFESSLLFQRTRTDAQGKVGIVGVNCVQVGLNGKSDKNFPSLSTYWSEWVTFIGRRVDDVLCRQRTYSMKKQKNKTNNEQTISEKTSMHDVSNERTYRQPMRRRRSNKNSTHFPKHGHPHSPS